MSELTHKELQELMTLEVDGLLEPERRRVLEDWCAAHPEAARELRELRRLRDLLGSRNKPAPDPYFWTRLSQSLEERAAESKNLLPFPSKFVPAASAVAIVILIGLGITMVLQRGPLLEYIAETSSEVQQAYENTILKGSILPLFSNIGNDEVLQYALFGTLPLDRDSDAALRVDEASAEGYRIEVGLKAERQPKPAVTVHDLMEEVQPTMAQAMRIDSVLSEARERIALAGFYAENDALAIDPEITQLNRRVLSRIVGVLEPVQRQRLDRFLKARNALYGIAPDLADSPTVAPTPPSVARADRQDFIVITPDSFGVTTLAIDADSLQGRWAVSVRTNMHEMTEMQRKLEEFVRSQVRRRVRMPRVAVESPVRIASEGDVLSIEVGRTMVERDREVPRLVGLPRGRGESFFRFEVRPHARSGDGFGIEVQVQTEMDSMMREMQELQELQFEEFRRLDSARASRVAPRSPSDSTRRER